MQGDDIIFPNLDMCLIMLAGWFNENLLKKNWNPRCNFIIHVGQVIIHAGKYFYFLCNLNSIRSASRFGFAQSAARLRLVFLFFLKTHPLQICMCQSLL